MRAPWRWHWLRIVRLATLWVLVGTVVFYATVLAVPLAFWLAAWIRAEYTEPVPSPTEGDTYDAVTRYNTEKRYNDAQTTFTPEATRVQHVRD